MLRAWSLLSLSASAFCSQSELAKAEDSVELAKKALNPVAAMYSLPMQYNWDQKMGPSGDGMHSDGRFASGCRLRQLLQDLR